MEILEMVGEVVRAQASHTEMNSEEMAEAIKKLYKALKWVEVQEKKSAQAAMEPTMSGPDSIQRNKVICLECGKEFKQISAKHLALHGTDRKAYRQKYGIPSRLALSAKSLSSQRRRVAKERGLGQKMQAARMKKAEATAKKANRRRNAALPAPKE